MTRELRRAIEEALESWETPDSPEGFCAAMIALGRVFLDECTRADELAEHRRKRRQERSPDGASCTFF